MSTFCKLSQTWVSKIDGIWVLVRTVILELGMFMKYSYRMSKSSQGILKPVEINKYMMKWKLNSAHNDQIQKFLKFRNVANNK